MPANIRLPYKRKAMANTLVYYNMVTMTVLTMFIVQAQGATILAYLVEESMMNLGGVLTFITRKH